jgi:hypothetical protein
MVIESPKALGAHIKPHTNTNVAKQDFVLCMIKHLVSFRNMEELVRGPIVQLG